MHFAGPSWYRSKRRIPPPDEDRSHRDSVTSSPPRRIYLAGVVQPPLIRPTELRTGENTKEYHSLGTRQYTYDGLVDALSVHRLKLAQQTPCQHPPTHAPIPSPPSAPQRHAFVRSNSSPFHLSCSTRQHNRRLFTAQTPQQRGRLTAEISAFSTRPLENHLAHSRDPPVGHSPSGT